MTICKKNKYYSIESYKGSKPIRVEVGIVRFNTPDIYFTNRTPEHYFRIFKGFGLSKDVYNDLITLGVTRICITYTEKKGAVKYVSNLHKWRWASKAWDNELKITQKIDPQFILEQSEMVKFPADMSIR